MISSQQEHRIDYSVILLLIYLYVFIATPQHRFEVLGAISIEKMLILICVVNLVLTGRFHFPRISLQSRLIFVFFGWMVVSYLSSPYGETEGAIHWSDSYWKYLVVYFLLLIAIRDQASFRLLVKGVVIILLIYQLQAWKDFLLGGAYVYQQGFKRIIHPWSDGGIGAANAFGMTAMFSLPFNYCWYKMALQPNDKRLLFLTIIICVGSIIYSGTRGALIGGAIFFLLTIKRPRQLVAIVFAGAVITGGLYLFLPGELKYRYFSVAESGQPDERHAQQQKESTQTRLEGLVDGWKLAMQRPLLGVGPGCSAVARGIMRPEMTLGDGFFLQLHNLYGQIPAETGLVGLLMFLLINCSYFRNLVRVRRCFPESDDLENLYYLARNAMLLFLYYGMIGHTLFRVHWFLLYAIQDRLHVAVTQTQKNIFRLT